MALAQKQTHRSVGQSRQLRNKPTHGGQLIFDKGDSIHKGEKTASSASGAVKAGQSHVNL